MKKNKKALDYMTKVAIFSAISIVLYFIKFPLPFLFPDFLDIQFSNLPAILGGLVMGPIGGVLIVVIRTLIKLPFTSTAGVGELADLLIGVSTVLTSSLVYHKLKTKKGGAIALALGVVVWVAMALLANGTFLIEFYKEVAGIDAVIGMCKKVLPSMNESNFMRLYLLGAILPFNLLLSTLVSLVTFFVYKRVSVLFKKELFQGKATSNENINH
ncbi:MAG: ECF transporter S component [Anaeroplasma bactoclasticum]|nr:ECF transporter S component [Anaeroplasma bactoclasticum]